MMSSAYDVAEKTLRELLDVIGASYEDVTREEIVGQTVFSIRTDDGRSLIGQGGDTVHALDHLVKKIVEKHVLAQEAGQTDPAGVHFLVDVNDYRSKQIKDLETKALMMAERARSFQYDVELSPMSAYERLIVHTALQNAPNVKTESQGEGRGRRVVIRYAA